MVFLICSNTNEIMKAEKGQNYSIRNYGLLKKY